MNKFIILALVACLLVCQAQAQYAYSPYYGGYYGYNGLGYAGSYYPSSYGYSGYYGGAYGYPYYGGYYGYGSNKGASNEKQAQGPLPSLTNNQ